VALLRVKFFHKVNELDTVDTPGLSLVVRVVVVVVVVVVVAVVVVVVVLSERWGVVVAVEVTVC
jgi:hypothetical protein